MKITDEQIKALIEFAESDKITYDNFLSLSEKFEDGILLLVSYELKLKVKDLISLEEFSVFYKNRDGIREELEAAKEEIIKGNDLQYRDIYRAAWGMSYQSVFDALYNWASHYPISRLDIKPIIIRTILEHYGEDFETFKLLYMK